MPTSGGNEIEEKENWGWGAEKNIRKNRHGNERNIREIRNGQLCSGYLVAFKDSCGITVSHLTVKVTQTS